MKKRSLAALFALLWTGLTIAPFTAVAIQTRNPLAWAPYNLPNLQQVANSDVSAQPPAPLAIPRLSVSQDAVPATLPEPGGPVTFGVKIVNPARRESVEVMRLHDSVYGNITAADHHGVLSTTCRIPQQLDPRAEYICSFSAVVTGNAQDRQRNTLSVYAQDRNRDVVAGEARATVTITDIPSSLAVKKRANVTQIPESGAAVTYSIWITNTSLVDHVRLNTIIDDRFGNVSNTCQRPLPITLSPGRVLTCIFSRLLQGQAGVAHTNIAIATGVDDDGVVVSANDKATVTFLDTPAVLTVQQTPSRATVPVNGALVTFTVQVSNSSPIDSLTIEQMRDSSYGNVAAANPLLIASNCTIPQTLPSGGQYTCQFSALLRGVIGTVHTNLLTVKATDDDNITLQAQASASVTIVGALMRATKRDLLQDLNGDGVASPGDTIGYTVLITNAGNVADIITFTDRLDPNTRLLADQATSTQGVITTGPLSITANLGWLAPASVVAINLPVLVVNPLPGGISQVSNQGLVIGDATPGLLTDDPDTPALDDSTATPVVADPLLVAAKVVGLAMDADGDGLPSPGDTLSYTIHIANVGNQQALGVLFHDPLDTVTTAVAGSEVSSQGQVVSGTGSQAEVNVQLGDLAVGATASIRFQALVGNPLAVGISQLSNQGHLSGANVAPSVTDDPSTTAANDPTRLLLSAAPHLHLTKRDLIFTDADGDNAVSVGDTLLYTLRLSNLGNTSALDILITDTPDPRTTLVAGKVQASGGQILAGNAASDRVITLAVPELLPQQRVDLALRVVVNTVAATALTNQATGRYRNGQADSRAEITFVSDDPDTLDLNDPTVTPLGTSLSPGNNWAFLPLIRR